MNGSNGAQSLKVYSMIKKIKRKDLDLSKYSTCLENSINYRIYAEYWYLDCLTNEQWDCLVYNDYEAIMPLPYQKKIGLKIIVQPVFCQQLGVFYSKKIPRNIFILFEKKLQRNLVRGYHFNEENTSDFEPKGRLQVNQILNLNKNYAEVYKGFRKDLRKKIKKQDHYFIREVESTDGYFSLIKQFYPQLNDHFIRQAKVITNELREKDKLLNYQVLDSDNTILSHRIYVKSNNRIIVLLSARNKNTQNDSSISIIHHVIKDHVEQPLYFDFEGSSLEGVNLFNKSFGSTESHYTVYKNVSY